MIDAHQHFIYPERVRYPDVARAMPEIHRPLHPEDLEPLLVAAGVSGTVVVQATNDLAETSLLLDIAHRVDWVRAVVGWVPLHDPAATVDALDRVADPLLVGVRHLIHREPDPGWLCTPPVLDALRVLAARGVVYELVALANGHLDNVHGLIRAVPDLSLVIDHLGGPDVRRDRWEPWASLMTEAAGHEKCVVKLSGFDPIDGSVERYRPYVEHVADAFGPSRMMWASNWPATRLGSGYGEMLTDARSLLPASLRAHEAAIFDTNARRVYGLRPARGGAASTASNHS